MKPEIILAAATLFGALAIALANVWNNYRTNKTNLRITKEDHEANLRLTQKAHEEEKKQRKREKLEQLMRATYDLRAWIAEFKLTLLSIQSNEEYYEKIGKMNEYPIEEIETLTILYFNDELEMEKNVIVLSFHNNKYLKKILEFFELKFSDPKRIAKEQSLDKRYEELIRLIDVLRNDCKTVMTKLDKW